MSISVLCTSVGNDGFQAVLRSLKAEPGFRVCGADANGLAYGLYLADAGYAVPPRARSDELVDRLLEIATKERIDLLIPLSTEDQSFYSKFRDRFESRGIRVAVSSHAAVETANHKHRLIQAAASFGVPVPRNVVVTSLSDFHQALRDFGAETQKVVVKKEFSTGAQGVKIIDPGLKPQERLFARDNIVITLDDMLRWSSALEPFPPLMVSEYLDMRHSVDIFLRDGKAQCSVVRTELARLYGMSMVGEVVRDQDVEEVGVAIAEHLGLSFTVNVEIGRDVEGQPKLVEINPRFPATIDHTMMAGCNMPLWTAQSALGLPYQLRPPVIGTRYVRHWTSYSPEQQWVGSVVHQSLQSRG